MSRTLPLACSWPEDLRGIAAGDPVERGGPDDGWVEARQLVGADRETCQSMITRSEDWLISVAAGARDGRPPARTVPPCGLAHTAPAVEHQNGRQQAVPLVQSIPSLALCINA